MAIVAYHLVSCWPTRVYRPHCATDETETVSLRGAFFAWMESAYSCRAFGRCHGTSRLVRRYRWVYHSQPTVSFTMRERDDLGMPNNDSRSHKRFGFNATWMQISLETSKTMCTLRMKVTYLGLFIVVGLRTFSSSASPSILSSHRAFGE